MYNICVHVHTFCLLTRARSLPLNLKCLPRSHINLFSGCFFRMLCPPLMHNSILRLFVTHGETHAQISPSPPSVRHCRLKRKVVSVDAGQWRRIQSLLCCAAETIMAETLGRPPPEHLKESVYFIYTVRYISAWKVASLDFLKTAQRLRRLTDNSGLIPSAAATLACNMK